MARADNRLMARGLMIPGALVFCALLLWGAGPALSVAADSLEEPELRNNPPYIPHTLTPLGYRVTDHTPTVCWVGGDPEGDAVTYYVYIGQSINPTVEIWHGTASCTEQLGNLVDGTHYYWRVRAHDGQSWSEYSTNADFAMNDDPSIPTILIPNTAVHWNGGGSHYVDWLDSTNNDWPDPDDGITYDIYYTTNGGTSWTYYSYAGGQSYVYWVAPTVNSSQCKLRVIASDTWETSKDDSDLNFTVDSTFPTSACFVDDFANDSPIAIGFTAADTFGTLDEVCLWYRYNGSAWTAFTPCGSGSSGTIFFTPSLGEGSYEFYTIAADLAGNEESMPPQPDDQTIYDLTEPTSSCSTSQYTNALPIAVDFNAFDQLSSIYAVELWFRFNNGSYTNTGLIIYSLSGRFLYTPTFGDGTYDFYTIAIDNAENRENAPFTADTSTILDRVQPTSTMNPAPPLYSNISQVNLPFTASDGSGSGILNTSLYRKLGQTGSWLDSELPAISGNSGTFVFTFAQGEGRYYFATVSHDRAGNNEVFPTGDGKVNIIYDVGLPASSVLAPAYSNTSPISLNWNAYDSLSGVSTTALWVKYTSSGAWALSSLTPQSGTSGVFLFSPPTEGRYYFATVCTDNAGNSEAPPSGNGDTTSVYDISLPSSIATSATYATTSPIAVDFTANDTHSGIAHIELWYKRDSSAWTNSGLELTGSAGTFSFVPTLQGHYYFATVAQDNAGNREETPSGSGDSNTIYDSDAPSSAAASPEYVNTGTISINWTATDNLSGINNVALWLKYQTGSWTASALPAQSGTSGTFVFTASEGDGQYCFATVARDLAGNLEASPTGNGDSCTMYDTNTPAATMETLPPVVYNDIYTMSYTYEDYTPGSGLDLITIYYRKDSGLWMEYGTDPTVDGQFELNFITAGGEGFYEFEVTALDNAGNEEVFRGIAEAFTLKEPSRLVNITIDPQTGTLHRGALLTVTVSLQTTLTTQITELDAYFFYDPTIFSVPTIQDSCLLQDNGQPWDEDEVDVNWDADGIDMDRVQYHKLGNYGLQIQASRALYTLQLQVTCEALEVGSAALGIDPSYVLTLTVQGEDVTGVPQQGAFTMTVNVVPADPVLSQSHGQWGLWVNQPPQLRATSTDPNDDVVRAGFSIDEGPVQLSAWTASGSPATYQPSGLAEGSHYWSAYTEDHCLQNAAVAANEGEVAFRLDLTNPGPALSPTVSPDTWSFEDQFTVSWVNPSDLSGIGAAYYKLDVAPQSAIDGIRVPGLGITTIPDIQVGVEGAHPLYLWLEDLAGNKDHLDAVTLTLHFDNSAPSVEFTNIEHGFCFNTSQFTIAGTASDNGSGLASVALRIDGGSWQEVEGLATWEFAHTYPTQKAYVIQAQATDLSGNTDESEALTIYYDNTRPTSTISYPEDEYATKDDALVVTGSATDQGGGLTTVSLSTDGGTNFAPVTGLTTWQQSLADLAEGTYELVSKAIDCAANEEQDLETVTLFVDRTRPESTITSHTHQSMVTGRSITISGTATDDRAGIDRVEVTTDAGLTWTEAIGTVTWTYEWQVATDGRYSVACRATDRAGNTETVQTYLSITVDNQAPPILIGGYWNSYITNAYGGNMVMLAYVDSPDLESVEIYFADTPTGLFLRDDGTGGDWSAGDLVYTIAMPLPSGMPISDYLLQIVAIDTAGNKAEWPHLHITDESRYEAQPETDVQTAFDAVLAAINEVMMKPWLGGPQDDLPLIYLGGYWLTAITTELGGDLDLWAYVPDPLNAQTASVELYFGGQPTGAFLPNGGGGLFRLMLPIPSGVPAGDYLFEMMARDTMGRTSGLWPYFNVY